jgi:hypothetical protein
MTLIESCAGGSKQKIFRFTGSTRKGWKRTGWRYSGTSAGTSNIRAKQKPRPHAKVPAKAGAFNPYLAKVVMLFWSGKRDSNWIFLTDLALKLIGDAKEYIFESPRKRRSEKMKQMKLPAIRLIR